MKTYTIHCRLSILGWKILYWREPHKKRHSTWVTPLPKPLVEYLMIAEAGDWDVPVLCSAGLEPDQVATLHGREWMESLRLDKTLIKKTIRDGDAYLTLQVAGEERVEKDERVLRRLDAYGKLEYVVGYSDEWRGVSANLDRGDWLACFDFIVFKCRDRGVVVAYHVVVSSDSGGFIDTTEREVVLASKAPLDLPDYWSSIGMEDDVAWLEEEIENAHKTQREWRDALTREITKMSK